jgi:hypothetical protein
MRLLPDQYKNIQMKIVFDNEDKLGVNRRWVRIIFLLLGILLTTIALSHIFFLVLKPKGYEKVLIALGAGYIQQLLIGACFLATYYLLNKTKSST